MFLKLCFLRLHSKNTPISIQVITSRPRHQEKWKKTQLEQQLKASTHPLAIFYANRGLNGTIIVDNTGSYTRHGLAGPSEIIFCRISINAAPVRQPGFSGLCVFNLICGFRLWFRSDRPDKFVEQSGCRIDRAIVSFGLITYYSH